MEHKTKLNILITGGLGFIGSNLAHHLVKEGHRVSIIDILEPTSGGNLYNIRGIESDVEVLAGDIEDFSFLCKSIVRSDVVVNCAARTSHQNSMKDPLSNIDVNCTGVINLLEAVRRFNPDCKVIQIGTTTQFGILNYSPADENHPEFPLDIYSANKTVSEKYIQIYSKAHRVRASVVRLPNVFGPRAAIHSAEFTFNNYFIGLALQGRSITVFGKGEQLRNVLYIDDAIQAIISMMDPKAEGEVFLATANEHYSVAELAEATVKMIGGGSVTRVEWPQGRKSIEVGDAVFNNKKIREKLGWEPVVSLDAGLELTRDYYLKCRDRYHI
jgi:UDP-glucose 4-epimerase